MNEIQSDPAEIELGQSRLRRIAQFASPGFQQLIESAVEEQSPSRRSGSVVGFVGCRRGSGTSTVSLHAAVCAAVTHDLKTLLVDANFRTPTLATRFDIASPTGLSNCLQDSAEFDLAVKDIGIENLCVMPNGNAKLKSRADLGSKFVELTTKMTVEFDLVIVDLPEAFSRVNRVFQGGIDHFYLVGNPRFTSSARMLGIKKRLEKSNLRLSGLFLNRHPA